MKNISVSALLLIGGLASAQDMPLHEIVLAGETWRPHSGDFPQTNDRDCRIDPESRKVHLGKGQVELPLENPSACAVALGGAQLLVADSGHRYIWAFRIEKDGSIGPGDRYCRLRVRGDDRRKRSSPPSAFLADPSVITIDSANRTYVATNLGIQIFDPTGRLCGVIVAPPGRVTELTFDGNRLVARSDGRLFVRKMLAAGKSK